MIGRRRMVANRVRLRDDSGFTVIEVVVAMLILAISTVAVLGAVDAASRNSYRAQQSQVVNDILQQEMEKLKQLPYGQLALTDLPAAQSTDPSDPSSRINGSQFNVNRTGSADYRDLVYDGGHSNEDGGTVVCRDSDGTPGTCGVDPGPTPFQSANGNVSGQIYRYVVWEPAVPPYANCANCSANPNGDVYNGSHVTWFKHIIVAVSLNTTAAGGVTPYQQIQGDVADPDEGQGTCTGSGCSGTSNNTSTPWTFWLTDTPCDGTSTQQRQPLTGDHLTHNTRGVCGSGATSGTTAGPPDLMFTQPAPCAGDPPDCSGPQPLYDFSTDVEPQNKGGDDKGVQLEPSGPGCATVPSTWETALPSSDGSGPVYYHEQVHKWLSPPIPTGSSIVFDGTGAVNLWTKTINGAVQSGKICVYLFYRHPSGSSTVDSLALNPDSGANYFTYTQNPWPTNWTELHIPLDFDLGAHTCPNTQLTRDLCPGEQLGVAISVDSGGTGAGGLEFMYDHPTYDTRLIVDTHSQVPF